ncbi:pyrroline-5-carboxylate reductase [Angulomicrobium tetraedrale]|uniref:Pyrroline-5-carboxylate reductase n=1 Tax=Ancylobacter tetraedralis TaxID=217068 RepID=A0A839Z588_9HYPH|nr:pyrroline-5-carboxylate reductase dimerization domain-containing protein [Ancylobacter tetraedralis]MBB3770173.1 pyrroline-5-carboxylate reductase [Ancylobacter tetraedralis]
MEDGQAPTDRRVGIIGGSGWLGAAFARGFLAKGVVRPENLILSNRAGAGPIPEAVWTADNQALVEGCDIVLLSVRLEHLPHVAIAVGDKPLVSLMAGVDVATLMRHTGARKVVRTMPNAAATIGQCYTPWYATAEVSADDRALVQRLFACCGAADEVPSEDQIDYFCGFTGAGAGYPALLARAMIAHAEARGIDPAVARRAATSVVAGASRLLAAPGAAPGDIIEALAGYRGTTAALIETAGAEGFDHAVAAGLAAAEARARELSALTARAL